MKGYLRPLLASFLGFWLSACGAQPGSDPAPGSSDGLQPGTTFGVLVDGGAQKGGSFWTDLWPR